MRFPLLPEDRTPSMNIWTFDLRTETDPLRRLGLHGLWRLLHFNGSLPLYQRSTLSWTLTDTTLELRWGSVADLNVLLSRMVGEFENGFCVPPGYPSDPNHPGAYATILAHKGVTQVFFTKKGAKRAKSLSTQGEVASKEAFWSTEEKPAKETFKFSKNQVGEPSLEIQPPPKKGAWTQNAGVVFHPMVSAWNSQSVTLSAESCFLVAFSCLSHVFIWDQQSNFPVGLGLDFPTFSEADTAHRAWILDPVLRCYGEKTAVWCIASALSLPSRSWVKVSKSGASLFYNSEEQRGRLYPIFKEGMTASRGAQVARVLRRLTTGAAGDDKGGRSVFDLILRNTDLCSPWYSGLEFDSDKSLNRAETLLLNRIFTQEASPMELAIVSRMKGLYVSAAQRLIKERGASAKDAYTTVRGRFVNVHLNRARNRPALLTALQKIVGEAGTGFGFSTEELAWILERSKNHSEELRSLLILSCGVFEPKKKEQDSPQTADSAPPPEASEEAPETSEDDLGLEESTEPVDND